MFWEITLDDYLGTVCNDGTYPLINTLKDCLLSEYYMSYIIPLYPQIDNVYVLVMGQLSQRDSNPTHSPLHRFEVDELDFCVLKYIVQHYCNIPIHFPNYLPGVASFTPN